MNQFLSPYSFHHFGSRASIRFRKPSLSLSKKKAYPSKDFIFFCALDIKAFSLSLFSSLSYFSEHLSGSKEPQETQPRREEKKNMVFQLAEILVRMALGFSRGIAAVASYATAPFRGLKSGIMPIVRLIAGRRGGTAENEVVGHPRDIDMEGYNGDEEDNGNSDNNDRNDHDEGNRKGKKIDAPLAQVPRLPARPFELPFGFTERPIRPFELPTNSGLKSDETSSDGSYESNLSDSWSEIHHREHLSPEEFAEQERKQRESAAHCEAIDRLDDLFKPTMPK